MNVVELWERRRKQYEKKLSRYLKYILNDHVLLVLMILLGLGIYQYAGWLKSIETVSPWILRGLVLGLAVLPFFGGFISLLEPADLHFLSIVEEEAGAYFKKALCYSLIGPIIRIVLVLLVLQPIWKMQGGGNALDWIGWVSLLTGLKLLHLFFSYFWKKAIKIPFIIQYIGSLTAVSMQFCLMGNHLATVAFGMVLLGLGIICCYTALKSVNWIYLLEAESRRWERLYGVLQYFTDIPDRTVPMTIKQSVFEKGVFCFEKDRVLPGAYWLLRKIIRRDSFGYEFLWITLLASLATILSSNGDWILVLVHCFLGWLLMVQGASFYRELWIFNKRKGWDLQITEGNPLIPQVVLLRLLGYLLVITACLIQRGIGFSMILWEWVILFGSYFFLISWQMKKIAKLF